MNSRVSLRDIAAKVGLHVSTVSLALRDSPRLPKATRERVQAAARELHYTPDLMLGALAAYRDRHRRSTRLLAFITDLGVSVTDAPHFRLLHRGASARAAELGLRLETFPLGPSGMTPCRLSNVLVTRNIDGVVLAGFEPGARHLNLDWENFCVVRVELQPSWPPVHSFAVDHIQAMRQAMARVRALGYRRPGLALGRGWSEAAEDRWEMAYLWEQRAFPCEAHVPSLSLPVAGEPDLHARDFNAWFTIHRPDVILGPHGLLEPVLGQLGVAVPQSVSFVDPFLEAPHPFYAGVVHHLEEVGRRAVEALATMLAQNIRGIPDVMMRSFVDNAWQDGASCPSRF